MRKRPKFHLNLNRKALNKLDYFLLKKFQLWKTNKEQWQKEQAEFLLTPKNSLPLLVKNLVYLDTEYVLDVLSIYKDYLPQTFYIFTKGPAKIPDNYILLEKGSLWHFLFDVNNSSIIEDIEKIAIFLHQEKINPNDLNQTKNNALHVFLNNFCYFGILSEPVLEHSFWKIFNLLLNLKVDINYLNPDTKKYPICYFNTLSTFTNYKSILKKTWIHIRRHHVSPASGYFIWPSFCFNLNTHLEWAWSNAPIQTEQAFRRIIDYINSQNADLNQAQTMQKIRIFLAKKEKEALFSQANFNGAFAQEIL